MFSNFPTWWPCQKQACQTVQRTGTKIFASNIVANMLVKFVSFHRAASFVEHFLYLPDKIILKQGVIKTVLRDQAIDFILIKRLLFTD